LHTRAPCLLPTLTQRPHLPSTYVRGRALLSGAGRASGDLPGAYALIWPSAPRLGFARAARLSGLRHFGSGSCACGVGTAIRTASWRCSCQWRYVLWCAPTGRAVPDWKERKALAATGQSPSSVI